MGQGPSHNIKLERAFAKNGCVVEQVVRGPEGRGVGVVARTGVRNYVKLNLDAAAAARSILRQEGDPKRVYYVQGTPFEQGYVMGLMAPDKVTRMCTTYLNHTAPQFVAESFDVAMRAAPMAHQMIYEGLLDFLTDLMTEQAVHHFQLAMEAGQVPDWCVQEMHGLVAGVRAQHAVSVVTWERIVSANYGMDYVMALVFSGRLTDMVRAWWAQLPASAREAVPFQANFLAPPDMCNGFMARHTATRSGDDVFLARDFQFNNAHVFHRTCTMVVRQTARSLHMDVTAPGLVGCVTSLNEHGVAFGVNLVRSSAVDPDQLGLGCMLTMRVLAETSTSTAHAQEVLENVQKGCPWIFYAVDASGDMRVFETVANRWGPKQLTVAQWVQNPAARQALMPHAHAIAADRPAGPRPPRKGVWARTPDDAGVPPDSLRRLWSRDMLRTREEGKALTVPARWGKPGAYLWNRWQKELHDVAHTRTFYFPPRRTLRDALVVNNAFQYAPLRLTQMTDLAAMTETTATANQWRFDTLTAQLAQAHGTLDAEACWDILTFLSPWKQPQFPQNTAQARVHIPNVRQSLMQAVDPSTWNGSGDPEAVPAQDRPGVVIAGALSLVDPRRRRMRLQVGLWGSRWFEMDLEPFEALAVGGGL
jgi:hypothetical protein